MNKAKEHNESEKVMISIIRWVLHHLHMLFTKRQLNFRIHNMDFRNITCISGKVVCISEKQKFLCMHVEFLKINVTVNLLYPGFSWTGCITPV